MMDTPHLRQLLESKGLKVTAHRMVIAEALLKTQHHPTADEVYQMVQSMLPAISRATVYNTLNTLVESELVRSVSTEPGVTRYDANLEAHHHFVDTRTGKIYDIPWENIDQLCQSLGENFKIHDYQITFYGEYSPT